MFSVFGPTFNWFAWHPVNTDDRGWRWLRVVKKRREFLDDDFIVGVRIWNYAVNEFHAYDAEEEEDENIT